MKNILFLLFFAFVFLSISAQNANWLNYTCGKDINCIAEEGNYLWIGTNGGLVRLDKLSGQILFYNRANSGLADLYVRDIAIDSQGNKWIATRLGLSKFDGANWASFYPPDINSWFSVDCLAIDNQDNIWIGSSISGLYKFDGVSNWVNLAALYPTIPFYYTHKILIDNGQNVWVGTSMYLLRFDGNEWTVLTSCWNVINDVSADFEHMTLDNQGNLWAISRHAGLVKFDGTEWQYCPSGTAIDSGDCIFNLFCDSQDNIWFGTWYGLLGKFDGAEWIIYTTGAEPYSNQFITSVFIDNQNLVWVGAGGLYNQVGTDWIEYNTSNSGLQDPHIFNLCFDNQNNLWVASGNALSRFSGGNWSVYRLPSAFQGINYISELCPDQQGRIWSVVYTNQLQNYAVVCLDGIDWNIYDETNSPLVSGAYCLTVDNQDNVWVGSAGANVYRYDGTNWTMLHIPVTGTSYNSVLYIGHDSQNNIWAFGYFGLAKYDGSNWTIYDYHDYGIPIGNLLCFKTDWQDNIWVGSKGSLAKFSSGTWSYYNPDNSGLPHFCIPAVGLDYDGNLWTRSCTDEDSGLLVKYDGITWTTYEFQDYPFTSLNIWTIIADSHNNLWMGTDNGITVYNENGIVANEDEIIPALHIDRFNLCSYPNPFNSIANISFGLEKAEQVKLSIYDIKGRLVKRLINENKSRGKHFLGWDGTDQSGNLTASGVYFCRIETNTGRQTRKLVLMK